MPELSPALQEAIAAAMMACEDCLDCRESSGLCPEHRAHVVPHLVHPSWVELIGLSLVEQQQLQEPPALDPQVERAVAKALRRNARRDARRLARPTRLQSRQREFRKQLVA